ncbi:MAG: Fe-S protein assembly co-chaperone HscB [Bryobacteraceae bacterium]|jgi:molecular chaperone HscB
MSSPDYFEFFGLEPKLALDLGDLEQRFYRLSRELHPDRFQRSTPDERERSLESSAILNDAYRTLRDPIARAEYALKRLGLAGDSKQAPPELLEEVFALNEALEERDAAHLEAGRLRFEVLRNQADAELQALFAKFDAGDPAAPGQIRALLNRRRYIVNLIEKAAHV